MVFTKLLVQKLFTFWVVLVFVFAFLSGCASSPTKKNAESETEIATSEEGNKTPFAVVPNPYSLQKIKVPTDADAAFSTAVGLMQAQKWSQAAKVLEPITRTHPRLSGPWVNLGICLWRQEQYEPAAAAFDKALLANSLNNDAYNTYAVMARELGQFSKAESLYKKAIEVWPSSAVSHRNLGVLYDMYMGRFDEALYHLEMSAKIMQDADKELKGWIVDIKRRQAKEGRKAVQSENAESVQGNP
jgi:tetratricopeptide (TPR) repeat protein